MCLESPVALQQNKMMSILFLVSSMQGGGAERVAAMLCNHWAGNGHNVTLIPTFSGRGECHYQLDDRVRLDYLADRTGSCSGSLLNKVRRFMVLRNMFFQAAPDVIVSFLSHVNVVAVLASVGLHIPVVVCERTYPPAVPLRNGMEFLRRFTYKHAKCVVVQTKMALHWLESCCPGANGKVISNPAVYPLPFGSPVVDPSLVVSSSRRVVLAVGRFSEEKGFEKLLTAFGSLVSRFNDWDLVIVGEGPRRESLETQRNELGLMGRVHYPGRVGNLCDWYARADLYVLSSRFEGFPNTLLEAMAHGLPAVSFDCETGPADIIRDGVDGYLVPPSDGVLGLARAMEFLMQNEDIRQRMGQEAIAVRERFSLQRIMAEWDEVLGLGRVETGA